MKTLIFLLLLCFAGPVAQAQVSRQRAKVKVDTLDIPFSREQLSALIEVVSKSARSSGHADIADVLITLSASITLGVDGQLAEGCRLFAADYVRRTEAIRLYNDR